MAYLLVVYFYKNHPHQFSFQSYKYLVSVYEFQIHLKTSVFSDTSELGIMHDFPSRHKLSAPKS